MGLKTKREILASSLIATGGDWFLRQLPAWRGLLVLNYHRIGKSAESRWDHDLWSATPEEFAWQVQYLSRNFDTVGVADLSDIRRKQRGRYVMITFDDGYRDNFEAAFPVLRDHHVPATFFLATGFLDRPHISWWDEVAWMVRSTVCEYLDESDWLAAPKLIDHLAPQVTIRSLLKIYKQLPGEQTEPFLDWLGDRLRVGRCPPSLAESMWMTWDMVREMRDGGMSFGGHTASHPILSRIAPDAQRREIQESCQRIQAETGEVVRSFSYPVGGPDSISQVTPQLLREQGIEWAFRFGVGFHSESFRDPLQIPRLAIEQTDTRTLFRAITSLPQVFQ